jgi:hypothetical protein
MKTLIAAISLLLVFATFSYAKIRDVELNLKGGIQPYSNLRSELTIVSLYFQNSKYENSAEADTNIDHSAAISAEMFMFLGNHFALGVGGNYFAEREIKDVGKFSFSALYIGAKYRYSLNKIISAFSNGYKYDEENQKYIYGVFHIGKAFMTNNFKLRDIPLRTVDQGYFAVGAGWQSKKWIVEILYSQHQATIEGSGFINTYSYTYTAYGQEKEILRTISLNAGFRFSLL